MDCSGGLNLRATSAWARIHELIIRYCKKKTHNGDAQALGRRNGCRGHQFRIMVSSCYSRRICDRITCPEGVLVLSSLLLQLLCLKRNSTFGVTSPSPHRSVLTCASKEIYYLFFEWHNFMCSFDQEGVSVLVVSTRDSNLKQT